MSTKELVPVHFTKNPTGKFRLAYDAGQNGHVTPQMAKKLVKAGYAAKGHVKVEDSEDSDTSQSDK